MVLWLRAGARMTDIFKGENEFGHVTIPSCMSPAKGVTTEGVFSLEESLESLKISEDLSKSLESPENGRILLCFPHSGGSLESLNFQTSLEKKDFIF